ncbi:hypothetical protein PR202_gb21106 [Eleusine coracana subsp. coracana]|uniref:X8 domain-containing protein n=1 Tax=Eleusine coracana subsp. coracana TaxID=191504 RepID=A0AAV5FCE6_ELECO|nr:hypothetical protein QOZ80_7BG0602310 [Eleusine coracana subsp. coracana]GJN32592.1 hypothetical protein PR202_gb21106 [Eleusine coracana subsp. coracana]
MALTRLLVFVLSAALPLLFSLTESGDIGVNYGRVADDLPDTASVVRLLQHSGITMVRIFEANPAVLRSLANTSINVTVMVPNEDLADVARDPSIAGDWVWNQVAVYLPATQINGVAVGNEVTTPIAFTAVTNSSPPSSGRFHDDLAQPVMKPMLEFLERTGSYLTMNIFPCFAFYDPTNHINRDYAVGNIPNPGFQDPRTGLMYSSLLDAQRDATYYAMAKLGFSGSSENNLGLAAKRVPMKQSIAETGWPARGKVWNSLEDRVHGSGRAATLVNAQAYNNNLINRVLSGNTGTPLHPDADMDVYIFALFNENGKGQGPDDIEQNWGMFYPNMTKVYEFDFHRRSWCVANAAVGDERLQAALQWACRNGADCGPIQPGGKCFEPNTMVAHAS